MEKTITVEYVKVKKEGDNADKPWTLYSIKDSEGNWYDSFEKFDKGQVALVEVTPNGNYNPNIKLAGLQPQTQAASLQPQTQATGLSRQPDQKPSGSLDTSDSILFQVCLKIAGDICKEPTEEAIVNQAKRLAELSKSAIRNLKNS